MRKINKLNRIFAPLSIIASGYLGCLLENGKPVTQTCEIQSPEARDWYLRRAEEKRKRKAEKLKRDFAK